MDYPMLMTPLHAPLGNSLKEIASQKNAMALNR